MKENYQKGSFLASVGWMGISTGITQVGTWISTIIIARLLTPSDYGLIGMSGLLVGIITLVGDLGLNASIIQKKEVSHKEISALFWLFLLIGILLSTLIYLLAPLGVAFWREPKLLNLIRLSALAFFIGSLAQVPIALLQKTMKFREYGMILSFSAISGSIVSIVLAYQGMGPYSLIYGTIAIMTAKLILVFLYEPFRPQLSFITKETIKHLKFGATITAERYLWWYYSNCDYWLASKFLGKSMYGSYSMAFQLASLPIEKITSIIIPVALPAFSNIDDEKERGDFYFLILKYMGYLSFPILTGLFWTAEDLIQVVLGEKWQDSIVVFKVFVLIFPLKCLASLNSPLLNSIRRADIGVKNMAIGAVLATAAFTIGVQQGISGLAYAWLFFYPCFFLICLYNVAKVTNISLAEYFINLKYVLLNTILMSLAVFCFQLLFNNYLNDLFPENWMQMIRLGGTILTGIISFVVFALLIDRDTVRDVINFIRKKRISI